MHLFDLLMPLETLRLCFYDAFPGELWKLKDDQDSGFSLGTMLTSCFTLCFVYVLYHVFIAFISQSHLNNNFHQTLRQEVNPNSIRNQSQFPPAHFSF